MEPTLQDIFQGKDMEVECPLCHKKLKAAVSKILQAGSKIKCPFCKGEIVIEQDPESQKTIDQHNKAIKDFQNDLKNMGFK